MPVVINEFDVVPAEAPAKEMASNTDQGGGKKSPSSENELERLVEHQMNRDERVWAH